MKPIRTHIMTRKLQWSVARCFQCSTFKRACGLPCMTPCRRLCVLVNGRLYHRFLCQHCIASIWGTISPQSTLPSRLLEQALSSEQEGATPAPSVSIDHPFKQGQRIGRTLIEKGVLDRLELSSAPARHETAIQYAQYAYPAASTEELRTLVAGILHAWMASHMHGEGRA